MPGPYDVDMEALAAQALGEEPSTRSLVDVLRRDALRKREALGEAGMAGGEWVRSAAAPVLQGARASMAPPRGESEATSLLKRTMAMRNVESLQPATPADLSGIDPALHPFIKSKADAAQARGLMLKGGAEFAAPKTQAEIGLKKEEQEIERQRLWSAKKEREAAAEAAKGERGLKSADDLRKEFNATQTAKDANAIIGAYDKIEAAPPNGQGDLALITMYMRLLDPSTGVKEGEFQNAAKSAGNLEQLRVMYDKVSKGELLTPETRERFKVAGRVLRDAALGSYEKAGVPYRKIAKDRGVNPDEVVFPLGANVSAMGEPPKVRRFQRVNGKLVEVP